MHELVCGPSGAQTSRCRRDTGPAKLVTDLPKNLTEASLLAGPRGHTWWAAAEVPANPGHKCRVAAHAELKSAKTAAVLGVPQADDNDVGLEGRSRKAEVRHHELHDLCRSKQATVAESAKNSKAKIHVYVAVRRCSKRQRN